MLNFRINIKRYLEITAREKERVLYNGACRCPHILSTITVILSVIIFQRSRCRTADATTSACLIAPEDTCATRFDEIRRELARIVARPFPKEGRPESRYRSADFSLARAECDCRSPLSKLVSTSPWHVLACHAAVSQ